MAVCKCYLGEDLVHSFVVSDRELKVISAEPGGVQRMLWERLQRTRRDIDFSQAGRFDHVVELGQP